MTLYEVQHKTPVSVTTSTYMHIMFSCAEGVRLKEVGRNMQ